MFISSNYKFRINQIQSRPTTIQSVYLKSSCEIGDFFLQNITKSSHSAVMSVHKDCLSAHDRAVLNSIFDPSHTGVESTYPADEELPEELRTEG